MKKVEKYGYAILFSFIVAIFLLTASYMRIIHLPYVDNATNLKSIRDSIIVNSGDVYKNYFYKFIGEDIYYITMLEDETSNYLLVSDSNLKSVDTYVGTVKDVDFIEEVFYNKYGVSAMSIDIGYQDGKFFYFAKYVSTDILIYAYYDLRTGEFTKGQQL